MKNKWTRLLLVGIAMVSLTLSACGGGGSGGGTNGPVYMTGQFIDSAVSGLIYKCSSGDTGITNVEGEFTCQEGDTVDFFVGAYLIGSAIAQEYITPYDLYPFDNEAAIDVARLLLTLDIGGDLKNRITIPDNFQNLDNIDTLPGESAFADEVAIALGVTEIISIIDAQRHLENSYEDLPKLKHSSSPYITTNSYYYIQSRTTESGNNGRSFIYVSLARGLDFNHIQSIQLSNDSEGLILDSTDFSSNTDQSNYYVCLSVPCSFNRYTDRYYWAGSNSISTPGDYKFEIESKTGEISSESVHYPGPINIPVIRSATINIKMLENGDVTVNWSNPSEQQNWDLVSHIMITLRPEDHNNRKRLQVFLSPDKESATIPSDVLKTVFNESEINNLILLFATRARDNEGHEYARGISNTVLFSGKNDVSVNTYAISNAFLQYRTWESNSPRPSGWISFTKNGGPISAADIQSVTIRDSQNTILSSAYNFSYTQLFINNCQNRPCSLSTVFDDSGISISNLNTDLPTGNYTAQIAMTNGQTLSQTLNYEGAISLPTISSASMNSISDAAGITFSWQNPISALNWNLVSNLRIELWDELLSQNRIHAVLDKTAQSIIIPHSIIDQASISTESNTLRWRIQTRSANNSSRGYSNHLHVQ